MPSPNGRGLYSGRFSKTTAIGQPKVRICDARTALSNSICDLFKPLCRPKRTSIAPVMLSFVSPAVAVCVLGLEPLAVQDRHPGSGCATWARNTHRLCRLDHFAPERIVTKRWPHYGGGLVDLAH